MSHDKMKPLLRKICFRKAEERNGVVNEEARQPFFENTKKAPSTPSNKVNETPDSCNILLCPELELEKCATLEPLRT
ncbi:hypothetical protein KOW79_018675 [Hemibagrus wyckioides]|uniref:Uncharacterized protein n=1 Tax=Hemibagrus wyckioides TaxID=337641 RepID=A0A9D3NAR0_9TELE|nr:hypothetical protein KOW79_018675 [Hemibagrus wyckioides]